MNNNRNHSWIIILLLLVVSCSPTDGSSVPASSPTSSPTITESPTSQPASTETNPPAASPSAIPTALPISEGEYEGWWTYTHDQGAFSLQLPTDWVVDETTSPLSMDTNTLKIRPKADSSPLMIRLTFRNTGEEFLIWPTGVGAGEFLEGSTLDIDGVSARRMYFVCPTGQVNSIWYMGIDTPQIERGSLEFGFIYTYTEVYCEEGYSLDGKEQHIGELIIASLQVP